MSSTINQKQRLWKEVEASLRSTLIEKSADRTTVLTAEDAATWSRALVLNCLILQDLLPDGVRVRSDGSLKQWCFAIAKTDILSVSKGLKEFQLFLRTYPDEWAFLSWSEFKQRYPFRFTGDFWSPVKDILISYLANPESATFRVLNQWVSFPLKLTLKGIAGDLTSLAEQDYLDNEVRLSKLELVSTDCDAMANVLHEWFHKLTFMMPFMPHHSNGAVSNRPTKDGLIGKYRRMKSDTRIDLLYRRFGLDVGDYGFHLRTSSPPLAKLITVPKGIDKRRSICPEPAEYQYNQQGVWDILDQYIQRSPALSRHIAIHDQTVNREAALLASRYQDAATIDLSSASDSVSWRFVKRVFRRCPQLLWMLWSTRSTTVRLPSGKVITTNKFAPMGSALCFPIESVLFAAMCQVAENSTRVRTRDTYHVYGDDIIVPTPLYLPLLGLLERSGFLVNEQKTFDPFCRYKESCGIEGLDGDDVSCLGISRKFSADPLTRERPELVACYVSFANDLYCKGFMAARTYVLASVLELPAPICPPFSGRHGVGIFSPMPTNWRAQRRFNSSYQCEELRVGCLTSSRDPSAFGPSSDTILDVFGEDYQSWKYFETLRRYATTKRSSLSWPDDLIQVSLSRSTLRLCSRWVPSHWFASTNDSSSEWSTTTEDLTLNFTIVKY